MIIENNYLAYITLKPRPRINASERFTDYRAYC